MLDPQFAGSRRWLTVVPLLTLATVLPYGCMPKGNGSTDTSLLRVEMTADPTTFDPAKLGDQPTSELLIHVYETLVRIDENNKTQPSLAEKWEISPDGKTYTFHLRKGVKFHTGETLKASDFKFSLERALTKKVASAYALTYLDGVVGAHELNDGKRSDLPGVKAIDDSTLTITLEKPAAYFFGMLAYPTNSVVCQEEVLKNGGVITDKQDFGTGAFKIAKYTAGQEVDLEASPDYWGEKPKISRLEYPVVVQADTAYSKFKAGGLDIAYTNSAHYVQDRDANNEMTAKYHLQPQASITYLVMQRKKQPAFDKVEVRKAFALAINRDDIAKIATKGVSKVATGFTPPQLLGSASPPPNIPYDPAQAKAMLAKAGYPDGKGFPQITLIFAQGNPATEAIASIVQQNLKTNLGINIGTQAREFGELLKDENGGNVEFYIGAWVADYPDAQDFLSTLLVTTANQNRSKYSSPKFDALCAQADVETDATKRAQLYAQADAQLMDDVGVLPLLFPPRIVLVQPNVKGWQENLCLMLPHIQTTKQ